MVATGAQTPLFAWHVAHGGRMVDFAGWSMPVQYESVIAEHRATRTAAGLFDVSHMGRIEFRGPGAGPFLERLLTRRVTDLEPGQIRYSLVTNTAGGILDDVLIYRLPAPTGQPGDWQLVVNASNRTKILAWIEAQRGGAGECQVEDRTEASAMLALQGPRAAEIFRRVAGFELPTLKYYTAIRSEWAGIPSLISRTGYTGEDGLEWIVPAAAAVDAWDKLLAVGLPLGASPAGLGARDTLRLEAAMPLYGHELSEEITPYQAGLGFAVDLPGREFPGRAALEKAHRDASLPRRVGLELQGRRPAREGATILHNDQTVGQVTSGTYSPTLDRPIAMAYVRPELTGLGTQLTVDIRGQKAAAQVVKLPFYHRPR